MVSLVSGFLAAQYTHTRPTAAIWVGMSIAQLNAARELIRTNPEQYPSLVRGVLPVGDRPEPEIRLWCSGFVADFFSAESVDSSVKDDIACEVLDVLFGWTNDSDHRVAKLGISILCEVYQRIYQLTWSLGSEMSDKWEQVSKLKSIALARWASQEQEGITVACVKLAQIIILAHQQVAHQHPVLDDVLLTAEAAGLLDRLLSIFPHDTNETFGVLSATLNAAVSLALTQPHLSPRIVSYITTFDLSNRTLGTPEQQPLVLRWVAKLFKLCLHPLSRNFPQLQKYMAGLSSFCANESLKRRAEDETMSPSKRLKPSLNDLPPGPQPYKAIYTLVDNMMTAFDARDLQFDLAVNMAAAGLRKVKASDLEACISFIKERLQKTPIASSNGSWDTENVAKAEHLKQPAPSNVQESTSNTNTSEESVNEVSPGKPNGPSRAALAVEVPSEFQKYDFVLNRLLGEAPIRVVARLSARGLAVGTPIKQFTQKKLYAQLVPDFRIQLEPLVLWLSEEYYADSKENYFNLVSRVVDEIIPRLELADSKTFIRLLSELPELNREIIFKIRSSCVDPERSVVGARTLKFLIMFKPPCREDCLDLVEELVKDGVESVRGILSKYRTQQAAAKDEF